MCDTWHPPTFGCLQPSLLTNRTIGTDLLLYATILSSLTTSAHFTYTLFHYSYRLQESPQCWHYWTVTLLNEVA